jgi:hypothetical protein
MNKVIHVLLIAIVVLAIGAITLTATLVVSTGIWLYNTENGRAVRTLVSSDSSLRERLLAVQSLSVKDIEPSRQMKLGQKPPKVFWTALTVKDMPQKSADLSIAETDLREKIEAYRGKIDDRTGYGMVSDFVRMINQNYECDELAVLLVMKREDAKPNAMRCLFQRIDDQPSATGFIIDGSLDSQVDFDNLKLSEVTGTAVQDFWALPPPIRLKTGVQVEAVEKRFEDMKENLKTRKLACKAITDELDMMLESDYDSVEAVAKASANFEAWCKKTEAAPTTALCRG